MPGRCLPVRVEVATGVGELRTLHPYFAASLYTHSSTLTAEWTPLEQTLVNAQRDVPPALPCPGGMGEQTEDVPRVPLPLAFIIIHAVCLTRACQYRWHAA